MKKLTAIVITAFTVTLFTQSAYAQSLRAEIRMAEHASAAAEKRQDKLATIQARGNKLIADRLNSLQKLLTRVQNDKRLSSSDRTSLINDINTTIANLTSLKTKIDADTDVATARADVTSIITNYRIYEIYEPKLILLITINNLLTANNNLTTLNQQIRILLSQLNINDPSAKAALDDMSTQLTSINTLLSTDKTLIANVTISTSDPKSVFTQVRKDLATARADFAKVRTDIEQIRNILKTIIMKSTTTQSKPSSSSAQ